MCRELPNLIMLEGKLVLNIQSAQSTGKKRGGWGRREMGRKKTKRERKETKKGRKPGMYRFIFRKYLFLEMANQSQAGFSGAFVRDVLWCSDTQASRCPSWAQHAAHRLANLPSAWVVLGRVFDFFCTSAINNWGGRGKLIGFKCWGDYLKSDYIWHAHLFPFQLNMWPSYFK